VRHFVHGEDFVCERDAVTLEVTLRRHHVPEGSKAPPVHAPFLPLQRKVEVWHVFLKPEDERFSPWVFLDKKVVVQHKAQGATRHA